MAIVGEFILLLVGGVVAASYGSVVGGGALVSVPLFLLVGIPLDTTIGTSRFKAIFVEGSAVVAFSRKGLVQWRKALPLAFLAVPFSAIGARLVLGVDEKVLSVIVSIGMLSLVFVLPRINLTGNDGSESAGSPISNRNYLWLALAVSGLALYGGFYGAGFGTFILFPFILLAGSSVLQASGNARLIGFTMSGAAGLVFAVQGAVDYSAAIPSIIGGIVGSQLGVRFAIKAEAKWISYALLAVIVASVCKLLFENLF